MSFNLRNLLFLLFTGVFVLNIFCTQKPRLAVAQTKLDVLENKFGRSLVNKGANKTVAVIAKGDTFSVLGQNRDAETDFFIYYKVKTKDKVKGFLFDKDSFDIIENH